MKDIYFTKNGNETIVNMSVGQIEQMYDLLIKTQEDNISLSNQLSNIETELSIIHTYHAKETDKLETIILEKEYEINLLNNNISMLENDITILKAQNIKPKEIIKEIIKSDTELLITLQKQKQVLQKQLRESDANNQSIYDSVKDFLKLYMEQSDVLLGFAEYVSVSQRYNQRIGTTNSELIHLLTKHELNEETADILIKNKSDLLFGFTNKFVFKTIELSMTSTSKDVEKLQKQFISVADVVDYFDNQKKVIIQKMKKKYGTNESIKTWS